MSEAQSPQVQVLVGDALEVLRGLPAESFQTCVTSPPYFGLRNYGVAGQIGVEQTPDAYVARLVEVFREVRRVLRQDGTAWLNLGDSYAGSAGGRGDGGRLATMVARGLGGALIPSGYSAPQGTTRGLVRSGAKTKDLLGIPWQVAFALRADGWWLRSDIIWSKPNPMPESVRDRPTSAHEHVFLLSKSPRYFYDAAAIAEVASEPAPRYAWQERRARGEAVRRGDPRQSGPQRHSGGVGGNGSTRNARNVWTIAPKPYSGAHFAVMPEALAERCVKAGSRPGDVVLDPFMGAGTTGLVARRLGRSCTGIELSPAYAEIARARLAADAAPKPRASRQRKLAPMPLLMLAAE